MNARLTHAERVAQVVQALQSDEVSQRVIALEIINANRLGFAGVRAVPRFSLDPHVLKTWELPLMMVISVLGFLGFCVLVGLTRV